MARVRFLLINPRYPETFWSTGTTANPDYAIR
jgi:hypothetical protein